MLLRTVAAALVAFSLAACNPISTMTEGLAQSRVVETQLESSLGLKPQVGFNMHNGRLQSVTVVFPRVHDTKSLRELTEAVRVAVTGQFKQKPDQIMVGFVVGAEGS